MSSTATSNRSPASIRASASEGLSTAIGRIAHDRACRLTISRFVALSSTTRSRLPLSASSPSGEPVSAGISAASAVTAMWNVDPVPSSLSTHIVPPISSISRFDMARPSPVPP
jgi:hypothetical protein